MKTLFTFDQAILIYCRVLLITLFGLGATFATKAQSQWQQATSNTTQTLSDVVYDNGLWVAVGANGTIVTSPDGVTWTPRTSNTIQSLSAAGFGAGQWIAVGANRTILTSSDGITWTPQSSTVAQNYSDIVYGAGVWVVTGDGGAMTSPDGVTWTAQNANPSQQISRALYAVSYGAGLFVAVGENKKIVSSPDGITWTAQFANLAGSGICGCFYPTLYDITFGDGKFVTIGGYGGGGGVASSTDGINWTVGSGVQQSSNIGYGAGSWLSFSLYGTIETSTNGLNWSLRYHPDRRAYLYQANYGSGLWVAVGVQGQIQYTTNVNAPLPVSLVSFTGQSEGTSAHLSWETAWEKGASHFLIERSQDAKSFEPVGRVNAQGNTDKNQTYKFFDPVLTAGLWYYRLRQVDLDGTYVYSSIVAVRISTEPLPMLTLSPNPSAGPLLLEYKAGISSVSVYSLTGVLIQEQRFEQAVNQWNWNGQSQPPGAYLIKVQTQDRNQQTLRWVKQ
ncbi:T9SS type A sorting domain-containing protein [Spirosoma validum]|uniref:T9SS type A sorting domain-containing protein n=1 Tax=Spirosoma validum TaxID=2771355 RepID=A0A927GFT9_9BACT|nr:T9SS type A sorting domain-containing protein [Spirosoma validum]MBD2756292.1 T9SS type A sorting domain-containing protein [Spirosoma validum]